MGGVYVGHRLARTHISTAAITRPVAKLIHFNSPLLAATYLPSVMIVNTVKLGGDASHITIGKVAVCMTPSSVVCILTCLSLSMDL